MSAGMISGFLAVWLNGHCASRLLQALGGDVVKDLPWVDVRWVPFVGIHCECWRNLLYCQRSLGIHVGALIRPQFGRTVSEGFQVPTCESSTLGVAVSSWIVEVPKAFA